MNRKDFFKKIGLTSVALAFSPNILLNAVENGSRMVNIDKYKWFAENRDWLMKWLDNYKEVKIPLKEIQKTMQKFTDNVIVSRREGPINSREFRYILKQKLEEHKSLILMSAVFAKRSSMKMQGLDEDGDPYETNLCYMSGFLEQKGRLPNKNDKVIFEVCPPDKHGTRFLRVRDVNIAEDYGKQILSDCRIKIIT